MMRISRAARRGYTLVELTIAIAMGMVVASMVLLMFNQQLAFIRIFRAQDFLTREAPLINNYVVRVIGGAEGYQLYSDMAALSGGGAPVLSDARVLVLRFQEADGATRAAVVSFEGEGEDAGLYYRVIPSAGSLPEEPDWAISRHPEEVTFAVERGILRMHVTGPNDEEVVYSGTQQL